MDFDAFNNIPIRLSKNDLLCFRWFIDYHKLKNHRGNVVSPALFMSQIVHHYVKDNILPLMKELELHMEDLEKYDRQRK